MKKAFTLVELLIVIAIIAILSGILMVSMSGGSESARSAHCLSNLRSLSAACIAYVSSHDGYYPLAGSVTYSEIDESQGVGRGKTVYYELPGWLSWYSQNKFPATSKVESEYPSAYVRDVQAEQPDHYFAVTNGALKASISGNFDVMVCPNHKIDIKTQTPFFSYVMNEFFYWNSTGNARSQHFHGRRRDESVMKYLDRRLLFAEINWKGYVGQIEDEPGTEQTDQVLQYTKNECIGFNHKKGKEKCAHVSFADGHTEQILMPKGFSDSNLEKLTRLLCEGKDISLQGDHYDEFQ